METPDRPALVLGASGYVGSHLVPRLAARGARVRAASRDRPSLEAQAWSGVEVCTADVLDRDTLVAAMRGVGTVYLLVHLMGYGRDLLELEALAARNVRDAAAACGVGRIVYLGALAPDDPASDHIRARHATGEILKQGAVPVTEVRAGIIVGAGSAAFEVMRDLVMHLPVMVTPRWVRSKSPPIALDNLLAYLLELPALDGAGHATYDVGGPETLSYAQMMASLARIAGRRPPWVLPLPILSPRVSSYWLWLVSSVPTNVARALVEGLQHDFVADDAAARSRVPQRLLTFEEAVRAAFEAERLRAGAPHFREGDFTMRGHRHEHGFFAKRASGSAIADVPAEAAWREVAAIGGPNGYYFLDVLWRIRELADGLAGGTGWRRSATVHPLAAVGDRVDSWEVAGIEPGRRITLRFGLKAPGAGALEFVVQALGPHRTRVTATAYWHPAGFWGLAYWWFLFPAHLVIFDGLTRAILRRAARPPEVPA